MFDHWEITVTKITSGTFRKSSVNPATGNVVLDSEDFTSTPKGHSESQRGSVHVHEFGHMLGLLDEYKSSSPHSKDYSSILNRGEVIKPRHNDTPRTWAIKKLKSLGIE